MFERGRQAGVGALLAVMVLGTEGTAQRPQARFEAAWAPVKQFFHETLTAEGVVGGAIMFVHGDTVVAREFHGLADRDANRPVDGRTIFHWASITKTFTAIALMQLVERGLLAVDDPVVRYVPELRLAHNPFGSIETITLAHLLSHSAGFRGGTWPWGGDKPWHPFEPTGWSQLVAMMPYTDVQFTPGTKFSYSNPGLIFVGRTIETLSGEDYEVYVDKNVLRPLGMTSSYFDRTPYHLLPRRSNNYEVRDGRAVANGLDFETGITVSNGGLNGSIEDLARYLQFLAGAPGLDRAARGVLDRKTLGLMWRPRLPRGGADGGQIGLGFFLQNVAGVPLVGHTGSQLAFRSFFWIDPTTKAGVVAVFNTAPADDPRNPTDQGPDKPRIGMIFEGLLSRLAQGVFPLYRP